MSNNRVMIRRGEVVAIGELKIRNSKEFPYEIPILPYIIIHDSENTYASTCIDLHIDGDGVTPEEAEATMGENVFEFLCINFAKDRDNDQAWDYLKELSEIDENTKESWDAFSKYKLDLAKEGKVNDTVSALIKQVSELEEENKALNALGIKKEDKIKELHGQLAEQGAEINQLNQKVVQLTALHMLRNYQDYNTYWAKRR